ncbi:hypothetical protein DFH28DRAFT_1036659 [Melampsora americana]|nr:hypothetical protein DFH28DRAFT_1036659 [Melampsora americana]
MFKPYARQDRAKKKTRNRGPDNDTQSLVNSLPVSLRFLNPQSNQSDSHNKDQEEERQMGDSEEERQREDSEEERRQEDSEEQRRREDSEEERRREDSEEERRQEDSKRPPSPDRLQGGLVNPIRSLFRSAVPSIPSVNLPMSPEDRAKFDQVANIFSLKPSYRAEALRLGSITGDDNCYWTILCLQQQARQQVAKQGASLHNDWTPDTNLPEQLKKIIRRTLGDPSIESYTETLNSNKVIIPGSFHRKAMQAIMDMSIEWKAEHLPPDFGTTLQDLSNHEKFMELFKAKLRHARDDFRLILLKEIWFTQSKINSKQPQVEVPALGSLLGQLYNFFDPSESRTEKELQRDVDTKTQARFAYLRMAIGIYNETSPAQRKANGGLTHWRTIDRKLAELRNKSHEYRRAFNAIVLARDQGLFNGKNRWDEIKLNDQFQIPSEEDVVTAIPYLPPNSS